MRYPLCIFRYFRDPVSLYDNLTRISTMVKDAEVARFIGLVTRPGAPCIPQVPQEKAFG